MIINRNDMYEIDLENLRGETNKALNIIVKDLGPEVITFSDIYETVVSYKMYSVRRNMTLSLYAEFYDGNKKIFDDESIKDFEMTVYTMLVVVSGTGIETKRMEFLTGTAHYASMTAYNLVVKNPPSALDVIEKILEDGDIPYAKYFDQSALAYACRVVSDERKKSALKLASKYKAPCKVSLKSGEAIFNEFMHINEARLEAAATK